MGNTVAAWQRHCESWAAVCGRWTGLCHEICSTPCCWHGTHFHPCSFCDYCSELEAAPRPPQDLLDSLLLASDEDGQGMADQALRDELLTLLVAGKGGVACLCVVAKRVAGAVKFAFAADPAGGRWDGSLFLGLRGGCAGKCAPHGCVRPQTLLCFVSFASTPPTSLVCTLLVGQETSAILLGWACAYLAHNPDAQAAAAAEVDALLRCGSKQAGSNSSGSKEAGSSGAAEGAGSISSSSSICSSSSSSSSESRRELEVADAGRLPMVEAVILEAMR